MKRNVRVLVLGINANGESEFLSYDVRLEESKYDLGFHLDRAIVAAREAGFDDPHAFDEFEPAGRLILGKFDWQKVDTIFI